MPRSARLFAAATTVAGVALLGVAIAHALDLPRDRIVLLAIAVLVTELMQVGTDELHVGAGAPTHFSFSAGAHLAAVIAIGPWGAALVAAFGVVFVDRLRGVPVRVMSFNASSFAVSTVLAGSVFRLAGGTPGTIEFPRDLAPAAAAAGCAYLTNLLLVSTVAGLASRQAPLPLAVLTARGQLLPALSEASFGAALGYFVVHSAWGALTLAPLLLGVYKAHARLQERGRETAEALDTFARIVDERDGFTSRHSARVAELVEGLARWVGLTPYEVARLRWAGRLHDLGKVVVDTSVLHKPGELDSREWAVVRRHPRISARILRRFRLAVDEALAVEFHHERFDGRGYYGIPDADLPLAAHILTVVDSFDAMTSDRPYRCGRPEEEALAEIERSSGTQFHPLVAKAFAAYVRGLAVDDVLTVSERRAFRVLWRSARPRRLPAVRPTPRFVGVGCAGVGLATLLADSLAAAGVLFAAALAAVVWSELSGRRRERLSGEIAAALAAPGLDARLEALVACLRSKGLSWAGLLAGGSLDVRTVEREWLGHGPDPEQLAEWIGRRLEPDAPLVADAREVAAEGTIACIPLEGSDAGSVLLVLLFDGRLGRVVDEALRGSTPQIASALAGIRDRPRPSRLTAVV